ncbi:hypothetical protein B7P43_G08146 [Cryptotermes secundus]|uniref:Uncharacterized protein n=1 Tax=Cryptotermes secundus TaxID=105785 RepID=A0A2J7PVQ3_9NEOP|nr:hypothetical protein B7P43_G08146 [Cryptotermes secundus]
MCWNLKLSSQILHMKQDMRQEVVNKSNNIAGRAAKTPESCTEERTSLHHTSYTEGDG